MDCTYLETRTSALCDGLVLVVFGGAALAAFCFGINHDD